jgi:hypothetical protein
MKKKHQIKVFTSHNLEKYNINQKPLTNIEDMKIIKDFAIISESPKHK